MQRRFRFDLLLVVAISLALAGCSSVAKWEFARAYKLEQQGKTEEALERYAALLERIPADNSRLRADTRFRMGELLFRAARYSEAFNAFEEVAALDPHHRGAQIRIGEMYLLSGGVQRAVDQARRVLAVDKNNVDATSLMAGAAAAAGNVEHATELYLRVLQLDPRKIDAAISAAELYNVRDQVADARIILLMATKNAPDATGPWFALGRLEEQEGNSAAAEIAYRRAVAVQDSPESNLRLAQFLVRSSRSAEAATVLGRVDTLRPHYPIALGDSAMQSGRADLAVDHYLRGLRSPQLSKNRLAYASVASRRAAMAARIIEADIQVAEANARANGSPPNFAAAELHIRQFRDELDPATRNVLLAELAVARRESADALRFAGEAVALAPESAPAHYIHGVARHLAGMAKDATASWLQALEQDPQFVPALLALAGEEVKSGNLNSAEEYVVPVVREEPGNITALLLYARVLAAQKRYASAENIAGRAAALDSGLAAPHLVLAEVAAKQKQYAAALDEYQKAILLDPYSQPGIEGLLSLYRRGRVDRELLRRIERVASGDPNSPTLMEIAARLYAERGWTEDAKRCFTRVLQWDRSRNSAAEGLTALLAKSGDRRAALASAQDAPTPSAALLGGLSAQEESDAEAAIRNYRAAVEAGEPSGVAANNLAWLLAERDGDLDEAHAMAIKASELSPNDPAVLDTAGFVLLKRREFSRAVEVLERALLLAQNRSNDVERPRLHERIREHLAEAYLRSGDTEAAAALHAQRRQ